MGRSGSMRSRGILFLVAEQPCCSLAGKKSREEILLSRSQSPPKQKHWRAKSRQIHRRRGGGRAASWSVRSPPDRPDRSSARVEHALIKS